MPAVKMFSVVVFDVWGRAPDYNLFSELQQKHPTAQ